MKPAHLRAISKQCREGQRQFTVKLSDQDPTDLRPGDTPAIGLSIEGARSDHRHRMSAVPNTLVEGLLANVFFFTDFAQPVPAANLINWTDGGDTAPFYDRPVSNPDPQVDPGYWGRYGGSTGTAGAPADAQTTGVLIGSGPTSTATETTVGRTLFDRMRVFRAKTRLFFPVGSDAEGDLPGFAQAIQVYLGGLITSTNRRPDTTTDGLFFRLICPNASSGVETWRAVSAVNGAEWVVDTKVVVPYQPAGGGDQRAGGQVFTIIYDPDAEGEPEARFFIGGRLVATITASQGLPRGVQLAGWGQVVRKTANTSTLTCVGGALDFLSYHGVRVVPEA